MVTYYFLAPDDFLKYNDQVGVYYWLPVEAAPRPGISMTPAPEVGKNVYKCSVLNKELTLNLVFNAFVDAGSPADPELVQFAPQTKYISVEGYIPGDSEIYEILDNFYGMIFVTKPIVWETSEYTAQNVYSGEWFSIDPDDYNYYRHYKNYYGTYGLDE